MNSLRGGRADFNRFGSTVAKFCSNRWQCVGLHFVISRTMVIEETSDQHSPSPQSVISTGFPIFPAATVELSPIPPHRDSIAVESRLERSTCSPGPHLNIKDTIPDKTVHHGQPLSPRAARVILSSVGPAGVRRLAPLITSTYTSKIVSFPRCEIVQQCRRAVSPRAVGLPG